MRRTWVWIGVLAATGLLVASSVAVGDAKNWTGSVCLAADGANQGDFSYEYGRLQNNAAVSRYAICPIMRDDTVDPPTDAWMRVDPAAGHSISCTLYCCNTTGSSCDHSSKTTTGDGNQVLDFDDVSSYTNCAAWCFVDPGGRIRYFKWEE